MNRYYLCFGMLLSPLYLFAQFSISGKVVDEKSGEPLTGAAVFLINTNKATATDAEGRFYLNTIDEGTYTLSATFIGYEPLLQQIAVDKDIKLGITLKQKAILADEVIVRATRASAKTPATYSEISQVELEKQNFGQDMPFLLNQMPSVVVTSDAGAGVGYTGIRIRGSDPTRINVTVNGIPINDSESHGVFWVNMPDFASSADNIQVQRGVGTSTNGAAAFGATIDIQTTDLETEPYAEVNNAYGSFNTRKHTFMAGTGLLNNRFTVDARLSKIASDGYIDRAASDLQSYFLSAGYHGKNTLLKLNTFSGKEVTYQSWYGTPEARVNNDIEGMQAYIDRNYLSDAEADNLLNAGRTYNFYTYDNQVDNYQQDHYQAILAHDFAKVFTLNTALHYTRGKGYYEQYRDDDDLEDYGLNDIIIVNDTITSTELIRRRWLDNDFYGITYALNYTGSDKLDVVVGGGWNKYDGDHFGEIIWARFAGSNILDRYYDNRAVKKDFNIYAKAFYDITDQLNLFGDLQMRKINYTYGGVDNDLREIDGKENFNFFNPKFGFTYRLSPSNQLYASYSIGNREPVRSDFIDAPEGTTPRPETLRNVEAGIRMKAASYSFSTNIYLMDYKDQLVLTGELNDVGASIRKNVDRSYRAGIELAGEIALLPNLQFQGNLTLSRNKINKFAETVYDYDAEGSPVVVNNLENTDISFSPAVISSAVLSYAPFNGLELSLLSKYVGSQYLDNTSSDDRKIEDYLINDVRIIYNLRPKIVKRVQLSLLINNISDVRYASNGYTYGYKAGGETITENFYYPQAGINVMAAIGIRF